MGPTWFADADSVTEAADVVVTSGGSVTAVDAQLAPDPTRGILSCTVTAPGGAPAAYTQVSIYSWDEFFEEWVAWVAPETDQGGSWSVRVAAGTDRVGYSVSSWDDWAAEYYDGAATLGAAQEVTLVAGGAVADLDAVLAPDPTKGVLLGTVTRPSGTRAADLTVTVYRYDSEDAEWYSYIDSSTADDGTWRATVPAGRYKVGFEGRGMWDEQYHDGAWSLAGADEVVVTGGDAHPGLDAVFGQDPSVATLSGTVTGSDGRPLEDGEVALYEHDGDDWWHGPRPAPTRKATGGADARWDLPDPVRHLGR